MMELYWAYADYNDIMNITEEMINFVVREITGSEIISYQGKEIDFSRPWRRVKMADLSRRI